MFERIKNAFANKMRSFLRIYPANANDFTINELLDFDSNVAVNKIWFRGESYELGQLYEQLNDNQHSFWGSASTAGIEIRKIHIAENKYELFQTVYFISLMKMKVKVLVTQLCLTLCRPHGLYSP